MHPWEIPFKRYWPSSVVGDACLSRDLNGKNEIPPLAEGKKGDFYYSNTALATNSSLSKVYPFPLISSNTSGAPYIKPFFNTSVFG